MNDNPDDFSPMPIHRENAPNGFTPPIPDTSPWEKAALELAEEVKRLQAINEARDTEIAALKSRIEELETVNSYVHDWDQMFCDELVKLGVSTKCDTHDKSCIPHVVANIIKTLTDMKSEHDAALADRNVAWDDVARFRELLERAHTYIVTYYCQFGNSPTAEKAKLLGSEVRDAFTEKHPGSDIATLKSERDAAVADAEAMRNSHWAILNVLESYAYLFDGLGPLAYDEADNVRATAIGAFSSIGEAIGWKRGVRSIPNHPGAALLARHAAEIEAKDKEIVELKEKIVEFAHMGEVEGWRKMELHIEALKEQLANKITHWGIEVSAVTARAEKAEAEIERLSAAGQSMKTEIRMLRERLGAYIHPDAIKEIERAAIAEAQGEKDGTKGII